MVAISNVNTYMYKNAIYKLIMSQSYQTLLLLDFLSLLIDVLEAIVFNIKNYALTRKKEWKDCLDQG